MSKPVSRTVVKIFTAVTLLLLASFATTNASSTPRGSQAIRQQTPAYAPEVVTVTATKTDSLFTDVNGNTLVDPGDTLQYTIVVGNSGDEDALNTLFTDVTDDTEVTVVAGSLRATPIGRNDAYAVIGNTHITHPVGTGVLVNDLDPDGGAITASCAPCTTTNGGAVTLNTDGSFTYNPPVGFTGSDTFTYTVTDNHGLTDTGTVTFTVTNRIWWVDSDAAAGGDGRSLTPFNTLAAAQTASGINDTIFIYNRGAAYTGGFAMQNGQKLCGHGADLATCSGLTPPTGTTFPTPTTNPTITNTAGNVVTLAQNNNIFGLTLGNSGSAANFALAGTNFGTLTIQTVTINTNNGGISLNTGTATATITSLTSSGGTNNITLTTVAGTLNLGSGALSGSSSHAFFVNGGTATINYSGTINNSTADAINIQNKTGGTVNLSGAVTSTGTGISLTSNTGATINLSGSLAITTGTNEAFTATGGGTFSVTGAINTVSTTTGTAVNIRNMTIGGSGVTFRSVSANGGANGIYLENNTGGTFTVAGAGSAGSGGTIQNMTGANGSTSGIGIYLSNTGNVSLNWMQLNGFSNFAIRGLTASNVALANSVVSGTSGDSAADDEGAISFTNLSGTLTFTNNTVSGGHEDNVRIVNSSGVLNATVSGSTIRDNTAVSPGNNGLWFQADGTANITAVVTNSSFLRNRANGIQAITNGAGVMDITVGTLGVANSGGTFQDNNIGVNIAHNSSGTLNFDVQEASFQPVSLTTGASPVNINLGSLGTQMSGTVRNNFIRNANSSTGPGIRITGNGAGTLTILINNNNIAQIGNRGIEVIARDGSNRINATITNNSVALTDSLSADGIRADAGAVSTDTTSICANINNNTSTTIGGVFGIRVRQRFAGTTYQLQGYGGSATDMTAVQNFLSANNNGATTSADFGGGGFTNAVCPTPSEAPAFTESAVIPTDETLETGLLTADMPALPLFTSDTDLKDESNPKQAAHGPEKEATSATRSSAFAPEAPEATTTVGPFTLPPGEQTTITFRVVVVDPFPAAQNPVCNQATISGSNFANVLSDDPDVAGTANPTCTTINITADLSITKTDGATTEIPGTGITYTIVASNAGPNPDPAAVVADTFPAAITGVTWTCVGAGGATCTASGSGNINQTVNLPVGGSVTFTASGTISPAATGSLANTATVATSSGITDPVPANNSATDTNTLTPQADVSITKTDGQTSDIPGTSIVYTIVASNAGPSNAPSVTVADTFPAALTGVTWTCAGAGGGTCTAVGSGNINESVNLPAGGSVTFTVNATILASATGTLSNTATATVGGGVTDPNPANNSATDTTTLTPQADVSITKTDGQTSDIPGTSIVYTIVASNAGPSDAPSVTIADTFPAALTGITWTCVGAGGGTCTAVGSGNISDTANLPAGGSVTYTIVATIDAGATGTLTNTATASSSVTDPNPGNNSATDNTTLTPQADLSITKTDGQTTAVPGQSVTYTIVASNSGPSHDPAATVADTFPAILSGVTWTCVGAGGATCTAAGSGNINDSVNLPAGGSVTYTASGTISAAATGTLVNTATVASSVTDPNPANNSATDTDTLTPQADLSITKTDGVATAVPGQSVTYTIVASNSGPSDDPSATVADTFPAILTGVTWTCVGAGGAICTGSGSGDINEIVNLPAGGSVTYTASGTISSAATGTLVNTATVASSVTDPNAGNNSATDTDTLTPQADLSITKADGLAVAVPGQATTYTITVSNAGPSNAPSASVADTFPAALTGVTWTCAGAGGGTCTAVGSGNIADTVNLPAGGSVTYIANATIDVGASGTLTNTATVTAPGGVTDPDTSNNSATDSTSLDAPPEITDLTVTPGTINENGSVNLSVTFTDPNTPEAHEVVIDWGDGSADTIINLPIGTLTTSASHQYLDDNPTGTPADNYTVTVTVNEADGGTDSDTAVVTVNNIAPTLSSVSATNANENGTVTLSGSITDPGTQDTFTLVVNWGDGSAPETFNYAAGATSFSETHQYLDDDPTGTPSDSYTISLTLTDDDTGSDSDSVSTTISNVAPTLSNVAVTANVDEGNSATLSGLITDPGTLDTFTLVVDWGDGNSDTYNYPAGATSFSETHTYADDDPTATPSDNVTISLTLTDDDTGSDGETASLTVHNMAPDLFNLAATPLIISETNTITLTGSIADPGTPDTFSLDVDWADGNVQTVNYPAGTTAFTLTHTYQDDALLALRSPEADFTIDVTLTDDDTGSDSDNVTVTVENLPPTLSGVSISSPVDEGSAATLSGNISDPSPNDTFALVVAWGDGITETFNYSAGTTSFSETHIYVDDDPTGTPSDVYTVTLTLTDDNGGSDTDSTAVTVQNVAPTLSSVSATNPVENDVTSLTFTITDPGTADTFSLEVAWGDGVTQTFTYAGAGVYTETHQYLDDDPTGTPADSYTLNLSLTDDDTGSDTDGTVIIVSNVAPALDNLAATAVSENGFTTLSGDIIDPGTLDTFTTVVDWGDGITETFSYGAGTTGFSETHQYLDDDPTGTPADEYTVTVTITDDDTGGDSGTAVLTVSNVAPDLFNVAATPLNIDENNTITITGQISDVGTLDSFTLVIDWADGITETFNYPAGTTSFLASHLYEDDALLRLRAPLADFDIVLTLTDDDTGSDSETITVQVDNVAPSLDNVSITDSINEGDTAVLTGSIIEVSPLDTFTLTVAWGDGAVDNFAYGAGATGFSESHTYADDNPTGTPSDVYTVTLTLVDDNGGTAVHLTHLTVHNVAPVVDAGADVAVNTGTAVTFNGSFTDVGIEDTHTIEWDFGDGSTAFGTLTPQHTYTAAGVYTAILTVTDDDTGVATDQVVVTVSGGVIFLPIIMNNSGAAPGPDLVVSSLTAVGGSITVVVTNQGNTAVTDAFWVDVYIDPNPVPTMVNQTWPLLAEQGLVWGVDNITLNPGQSLTLTINDAHYRADLSYFSGSLPPGTPVYAQVDSANTNTTYGNVLENHESSGGVYNNITGTMAQ